MPNLKHLELNFNKINSFKDDFPSLELLKLEDSDDLDNILEVLNEILKKNINGINYNSFTLDDFNKKYNSIISKKKVKI